MHVNAGVPTGNYRPLITGKKIRCVLRECTYGECAHEQHVRRTLTLTLTHTITAYSVSGNIVCVRILICATRQTSDFFPVINGLSGNSPAIKSSPVA